MTANEADLETLAARLLEIVSDCWRTQAIYAFTTLGIGELLAIGERTAPEISAELGLHPEATEQLLNGVLTLGIVERMDRRFSLTPMGSLLTAGSPCSVKNWTMWWGMNLWPLWGNLHQSVRTGESARRLLAGTEGFEHIQNDPRAAAIFHSGLAEVTRMASKSIAREFDFSRFSRLMDVGGGHGQLLAEVLRLNPGASGILLEQPHAIDGAKSYLSGLGLLERAVCLEGDFFDRIPPGADAIILKSVLHDWKDEDAIRILDVCRRSMDEDSRLLLIERLMPDNVTSSPEHQVLARGDLTMLIAHGSGERTEGEFRLLLSKSGLHLLESVLTTPGFSVLVAGLDPTFHQ